jgi:hypothetical protein
VAFVGAPEGTVAEPALLYIIGTGVGGTTVMMFGFVARISEGGFVAETLCTVRSLNWIKPPSIWTGGGGAIGVGMPGETIIAGPAVPYPVPALLPTAFPPVVGVWAFATALTTNTAPTAKISNFFIDILYTTKHAIMALRELK